MIAASTPGQQTARVNPRKKVSQLNVKEIDIVNYQFSTFSCHTIKFEILPEIHSLGGFILLSS